MTVVVFPALSVEVIVTVCAPAVSESTSIVEPLFDETVDATPLPPSVAATVSAIGVPTSYDVPLFGLASETVTVGGVVSFSHGEPATVSVFPFVSVSRTLELSTPSPSVATFTVSVTAPVAPSVTSPVMVWPSGSVIVQSATVPTGPVIVIGIATFTGTVGSRTVGAMNAGAAATVAAPEPGVTGVSNTMTPAERSTSREPRELPGCGSRGPP